MGHACWPPSKKNIEYIPYIALSSKYRVTNYLFIDEILDGSYL